LEKKLRLGPSLRRCNCFCILHHFINCILHFWRIQQSSFWSQARLLDSCLWSGTKRIAVVESPIRRALYSPPTFRSVCQRVWTRWIVAARTKRRWSHR